MSSYSNQHLVRRTESTSKHRFAAAPLALATAMAAGQLDGPGTRKKFSTPHLAIRKGGGFFFQRRYPKAFMDAGIFKRLFYRFNLATSNVLEAEQKAMQVTARFDRVMARLTIRARKRNPNFGVLASAVPCTTEAMEGDLQHLALRFEALVLLNDEIDRGEELTETEFSDYLETVEAERRQLQVANARGNYESHSDIVDGFLEAEGMQRPKDPNTYKSLCRAIMQSHLGALTRILERIEGVVVPSPNTPPPVGSAEDYDHLTVAIKYWESKVRPARKTILELEPIWARFQAVTGRTRISLITRKDILRFQSFEANRINKTTGRPNRPQSVNKKLALVNAVIAKVCIDVLQLRGIANPLEGFTRLTVHTSDVIDKLDLSLEDLSALFDGPVHNHNFRPVGGAGEASFWLPILGYSVGFRMAELGQLSVNDILLRDGIWCIWVTTLATVGEPTADKMTPDERENQIVKSLKNRQSRRLIPIHPDVLKLGFIEFVEWARTTGSTQLFRDIRADSKGSISGNFSAWYSRYLKKLGIKRPGLDWVSFRHTFKTSCRSTEMPQDAADYLEGHAAGRNSTHYGRFLPNDLFKLISVVELPGLRGIPVWTPPEGRLDTSNTIEAPPL